jgi:hypothetical protein
MTNPTSNFGWQMPTSTDLVTDLPADFEVFGQAVDTSLADLKGGTSGQILSKATNADMDFTWITNDVGDITAVTAGTGITGGGTSGAVTVSFDQANFGGGQNSAGKNGVINGAMDFFQRSATPTTGLAITGGGYLLDRWAGYRAVAGSTGSRQSTNDTTNLPFIQYCARIARDSGNTSTSNISIGQSIETSNSTPYVGKIVTVSFYARAGANYSSASSALGIRVLSSTSVDASIILAGGTSVITSTATLTTTWQRFTYTSAAVVGSTAKTLGVLFDYTPVGTAGAADFFEVTGVQLEAANTASNFQRAAGNIQGELAACQRYYWRSTGYDGARYSTGLYESATNFIAYLKPPVTMRVAATVLDYAGLRTYDSAAFIAVSAVTLAGTIQDTACVNCTVAGATTHRPGLLVGNAATSFIGLSAEL